MRQMGGYSDMAPGKVSSGLLAFKERAYRIIISPPGSLPQDPSWGLGIQTYIGRNIADDRDLRSIEAIAKAAHMKDPECADAKVSIARVDGAVYKYSAILTTKSGAVVTVDKIIQVTQ